MIEVGSTSPWCEWIALIIMLFSLYFLSNSTPISTWLPSTSWSMALPTSCNNPARLAKVTSSPNSAASIPERWATSIECLSTFWP